MQLSSFLQFFVLLPLFAFVLSLCIPRNKEKIISFVAVGSTAIHLVGGIALIIYWLVMGSPVLDIKHIVLYRSADFEFFIDFYFDATSAVYLFTGSSVLLLVSIFSKYYLHRDEGFKRFFSTLLLFFLGYNFVVISGNFETLFIGWEILGFCSFLLIAFYRDRYLPVKNALKVISVYRLGDVCLMLAMWMCHHLFHQNITFLQLTDTEFISGLYTGHEGMFIFIAVMLVIAASAKSAMAPFSSWLPRAMEGPTTSSAVFYGSLSLHLGAFLLIRTYPFWENILSVKIAVIVIGLVTAVIASMIAKVQSTVKTQIAYSSITQMGIIFIEVALGLHWLALLHFVGNAFLRTYQLLVSPSVLSYEIHDMVFNYKAPLPADHKSSWQKFKNALYILSIKEWNMDRFQFRFLWNPFKRIGGNVTSFKHPAIIVLLAVIFAVAIYHILHPIELLLPLDSMLPFFYALIGMLFVLQSFAHRGSAKAAWLFIVAGQCFITLSIVANGGLPVRELLYYFSGIVPGAVVGLLCLAAVYKKDHDISLNNYHGYNYEMPKTGFLFLLALLCMLGFPITATFLGIDLLFTHIRADQPVLIIFTAISFIFIEIALLRIYSRIFLGMHKKNYHPIAFRSS